MAISLFYFHHLLSSKKISTLRTLSKSLGLRGVYKRGYPGLLLVSTTPTTTAAEGSSAMSRGSTTEDLRRFVKLVKQMRWQSCSLCGGGIKEDAVLNFDDGWIGTRGSLRGGVQEVDAIRDVVKAAATGGRNGNGKEEEEWVKRALGLGGEELYSK